MITKSKKRITQEFPRSSDGQICEYLGYIFTKSGKVFSPHGKEIIPLNQGRKTGNSISLIVTANGKKKLVRVNILRAIYSMFCKASDTPGDDSVIVMIDEECGDTSFKNLKKVKKVDYIRAHSCKTGKRGRKRIFDIHEEMEIKDYYSKSKNYKKTADKFGCSALTIQKVIKGVYFEK